MSFGLPLSLRILIKRYIRRYHHRMTQIRKSVVSVMSNVSIILYITTGAIKDTHKRYARQ